MLPGDCSCDIFVKKVAVFYTCPKSLTEVKEKSFGLILLAEEISKQLGIDSVVWLLMVTLMNTYNE